MKKIFTLVLFSVLMATAVFAQNSEKNILELAGQKITESGEITNQDWLEEGKVMWDKENATLTLDHAKIKCNARAIRVFNADNFRLNLVGKNEIKAVASYCIVIGQNGTAKIDGDGSLTLSENSTKGAILIGKFSSLEIADCSLDLTAQDGIVGSDGKSEEKLIINKANVRVNPLGGMAYGAIYDFSSLILQQCKIVTPAGAIVEKGAIVNPASHERIKGEVVIEAETSSIEERFAEAKGQKDSMTFDLQGRAVQTMQHGCLYIKNGKKFVFNGK